MVDLTAWVSNITEQIIASIHSSKTNNYSVATTKKLSVLKSCLNIIQFMCASNVFNDESKNKEDGAELASVLFHNTVQMNPQDSDLIVHMSEVCIDCTFHCIEIHCIDDTSYIFSLL